MKHVEESHILSLRDPVSCHKYKERLHLNVGELLKLLHDLEDTARTSPNKGKKRAASSSPDNRPRKRSRNRRDSSLPSQSVDTDHSEDPKASAQSADDVLFPVYRHAIKVQYTTAVDHDRTYGVEKEWLEQEAELMEWLKDAHKREADFREVELGELKVVNATGARISLSPHRYGQFDAFITIPTSNRDFKPDDHDIRQDSLQNQLRACYLLTTNGRAQMSATLKLEFLQPDVDANVLPFRLHVDIDVSLVVPAIFGPTNYSTKSVFADVEEAQRRFLTFIFPDPPTPSTFNGKIDIPLLYSILRPAPRLHDGFSDLSAQPTNLVPTLLPFQRRSVAWMLEREGKTISEDGEVTAKPQADADVLPMFWSRIEPADGVSWYYHRLTGRVSLERPKDENVKALGGILAEEPGLGKTLECISLILLNPSLTRTPTAQTWDPIAKVNVKEVKVCLQFDILFPSNVDDVFIDDAHCHTTGVGSSMGR